MSEALQPFFHWSWKKLGAELRQTSQSCSPFLLRGLKQVTDKTVKVKPREPDIYDGTTDVHFWIMGITDQLPERRIEGDASQVTYAIITPDQQNDSKNICTG